MLPSPSHGSVTVNGYSSSHCEKIVTGFGAMNTSDSANTVYRAYLLRLRHMGNGGNPRWVYSLESPDGDERHEFGTLQALTEFLALRTPLQSHMDEHYQSGELDVRSERAESRRRHT